MVKRLYVVGLVLMGMVALGAAAPSGAGAVELSILPTGTEEHPLAFVYKSVGNITFELAGGKKVECTALKGKGKTTSARLGKIELIFTGCETLGIIKCTGLADTTAGEISFVAEFHYRHLLNASEGVALVILPGHVHFSCVGTLLLLSGCVASMDLLTEKGGLEIVEKLVASYYVSFLQEKGVQKPTKILNDASSAGEICHLEIQEEGKAAEQAGMEGEGTAEGFEDMGAKVTMLVHLK